MDLEKMTRTLHWSLRHMLDDSDLSIRHMAAQELLALDGLDAAALRDIALKANGEEARTAFTRLLALRPQDEYVSGCYCAIMWGVPEFAEASAIAMMDLSPNRNTYHAVIGTAHIPRATREAACGRLRPTLNVHDVVRLYHAVSRTQEGPDPEAMAFARSSFEELLTKGATNEDLRILCLYVTEIRDRTWQLLIARGPTKEDLEWTARSNRYKWDDAKAMLARGEYLDAPAA